MRKIILIICLLLNIVVVSSGQNIDEIKINVDFKDESLKNILTILSENYPVKFFYKEDWLPDSKFTIAFDSIEFITVLSDLLKDTDLNYIIYHNLVIVAPDQKLSQEFSRDYFIMRNKQRILINSKKWAGASTIINIGDTTKVSRLNQATISGNIKDRLSEEPLAGVNLYFETLDQTTSTDSNGRFELELPTGYNLLEISYVGYETQKVVLRIFNSEKISIQLAPDAYELEEILIRGQTDDNNVQSVIMGITRLRPQQIENLPVFLGEPDVIKGILTLPGISSIGEGAGGFNVRGGNIDQNLILQDETLVFNSSHALGFFSIFNSDAIREVELYKGHIPAQYGGRLSSVLNVKLKGNNNEKISGKGGIGLVSSRFVLDGPLRSKKSMESGTTPKTTFLLGGRITYSDWVLRMINIPSVKNSSGYFYDINAKLTHRYNDKGSITGSYYQSYDFVQFSEEFGFSWTNRAASVIWNHLIKPEVSSNFSVSIGNNDNLSFKPEGVGSYNLANGINNFRLKEDILISSIEKHNIMTGIEYIYYDVKPDVLSARNDDSTIIPELVIRDDAHEIGIFANDEFIINHLFSVTYGLRYNLFQQLGPAIIYNYEMGVPKTPETLIDSTNYGSGSVVKSFQALEPRLSIKYSLNPTSSVKFSYNRMHQFIHLISNTTAAIPVDFWQVSNPYLDPERSDNFSIGYFRNFMNNIWETSIEMYYRQMKNLIEYKDFPELLLNDHLETELLTGIGRSYGVELFIRRRKGKVNGWLSYTFSRSFVKIDGPNPEETINQGEWFPSRLDRPNNLNIVLNIDLNKSNTFSANFTYQSGRPITAPASNFIQDNILIPYYSDRNQFRIPDYHRLDVSYTIKRNVIKKRKYKDSFTISIYNLYGRKNAYSIFFRKKPGSSTNAYKLSIIGTIFPSLTYNFQF